MTVDLKELEAAGVNFSVNGLDCGFFEIPANEIPMYLTDPLGWYAQAYRVSRERIEQFNQFVESGYQCRATTRRGTRCQNRAEDSYGLAPNSYDPTLEGFCKQHRPRPDCAAHNTVAA